MEQLNEEVNLNIPDIACIKETPQRCVILYFADMDEKINCPLDYLKARLLRRFVRTKRQGRLYLCRIGRNRKYDCKQI